MKSFFLSIFALILVAVMFPSCGGKKSSTHSKTIGVSLLTRAHIFYKDLEDGLVERDITNWQQGK